jgi:hypothetical protein
MSQTIDIEDIKRLNVKPGDVLLVTVPQGATADQAQHIKNLFETNLPIRVVVKTAEVEVEIVGEADAS